MDKTTEEKAKELLNKFMLPIDGLNKYPMCFDTAKQCALICVEEVMKAPIEIKIYVFYDKIYTGIEYWEEVKNKLILLK